MTNNPTSPFQEMLSILRQHQEGQLEMNRNLIEALPPEVKARVPHDAMDFIAYGYMLAYADAEKFCRDLLEAEKQKEARHGTA